MSEDKEQAADPKPETAAFDAEDCYTNAAEAVVNRLKAQFPKTSDLVKADGDEICNLIQSWFEAEYANLTQAQAVKVAATASHKLFHKVLNAVIAKR